MKDQERQNWKNRQEVKTVFLARFPVSVKASPLVASANTENFRRMREKPLVPRV